MNPERKNSLHPLYLDWATYLGYAGYAAGSVVIPMVLLSMSNELGFSLTSGGALHLVRSTVMVVSMAASGYVAARMGKRRTLCGAVALIAAGLLCCGCISRYGALIAAIAVIGIGNGFFESLATGFTQDLHAGDSPNRYINVTHSFWPLGILITVLGSGLWMQYGGRWRALPLAVAVFLLIPAVMYWGGSRRDPGSGNPQAGYDWRQIFAVIRNPRFLCFLGALFLAGGSEHCFIFWIPSLTKLEFGSSAFVNGLGVALFAVGMFTGRLFSGMKHKVRTQNIIIGCAVFCAAASLVIPHLSSPVMLLSVLLLLGFATGPLWPNLQYSCAAGLPQFNSTLLYILMPLFGIPGCGVCTYLLGVVASRIGMRNGFYVVFICNLLIVVLTALVGGFRKRDIEDHNQITGR